MKFKNLYYNTSLFTHELDYICIKAISWHFRVDDTLEVYIHVKCRNLVVTKTDDVICQKIGDSQSTCTRARTSLKSQPL